MSPTGETIEKLDAPERVSHQHWEWTIERLGWIVMAGLIVTGLLGGLGRGPLTWRDVSSEDGSLRAKYYAVERAAAPTQLALWWDSSQVSEAKIEVAISRSFSDGTTLDSIVPEPLSVATGEGQIVYTFAAADSAAGGKVVFQYQHEEFGPFEYQVAIEGREPVRVRQFVLP